MTASGLYEGTVRHRRFAVSPGEFRHPLALAYVDLDELPDLLGGRLLRSRPGLLRFRRRDYLGDPAVPLAAAVRARAAELTGHRPEGPIRVLTQLRTFGHCFNPISFYYCFDGAGQHVEMVLAEVTNTPWGERHAYALTADSGAAGSGGPVLTGAFAKRMHVSPFLGMDYTYRVRMTPPGETLSVHIENLRGGRELAGGAPGGKASETGLSFDATLALRRRELTPRSAAAVLARYPFATLRVLALIYGHAAGLALRRVPVHPHPRGAGA